MLHWILWAAAAVAGPMRVTLAGVEPDGQPLVVALFDSAEAFPEDARAKRRWTLAATAETLTLDLGEVAPGTWAITVHHDQDADGELDFRWLPPGPSEGTSASCARRPLAIPTWRSCSFEVSEGPQDLRLQLWY